MCRCTECLRASPYSELASELEITKALTYLRERDVPRVCMLVLSLSQSLLPLLLVLPSSTPTITLSFIALCPSTLFLNSSRDLFSFPFSILCNHACFSLLFFLPLSIYPSFLPPSPPPSLLPLSINCRQSKRSRTVQRRTARWQELQRPISPSFYFW